MGNGKKASEVVRGWAVPQRATVYRRFRGFVGSLGGLRKKMRGQQSVGCNCLTQRDRLFCVVRGRIKQERECRNKGSGKKGENSHNLKR